MTPRVPVSCDITSSVEMRPGDVIFTSGGTQLVTDMRPMCRIIACYVTAN